MTENKKLKDADNIFGRWPILDIDGNIVLCPTVEAARHLAHIYDIRHWPWLEKKEAEEAIKSRELKKKLAEKKDPLISTHFKNEEADDEERIKLMESHASESTTLDCLDDVEREISRRSGVNGFFHDKRVMSSPRPYVVAV